MLWRTTARRAAQVAAACGALTLVTGCPTQPQLSMEEPGRPTVTWQHETGDSSETPDEQAQKVAERELLAEVRDAQRKGTDELALAGSLYNLAILRRQQGAFAESEQLYRQALDIRERKRGPNHPDVATTLNNLAGLEAAQGKYDEAQPMLERALTIRQNAFGTDHVLTAESMSNLALLYAAQGNAAQAEPLYRQAIAVLEKTSGTRQGQLDRVLDNYAAMLHESGRDAEAGGLEARARLIRAGAAQQTGAAR